MERAIGILLLYLVFPQLSWAEGERNIPLFFEMGEDYTRVVQEAEAFVFASKDSNLEHQMLLLSDKTGNPLFFYSDIYTPVCIDNVCKPVQIEIYWNLLGEYVGFALEKEQPLTKFDHEEFESADYEKFHQLLLDEHSVLDRQSMDDLFDEGAKTEPDKEQVVFNGVEVDAVSEPTKKVIRESTVEGALYSCYTLWHLVHGEVRQKVKNYFARIYHVGIEQYLLASSYENYQLFALKKLEAQEYLHFLPQILSIFEEASPLVRSYILKKLPDSDWKDQRLSQYLYEHFSQWDMNTQTLLLKHLEFADEGVIALLCKQVQTMRKRQLVIFLDFMPDKPSDLDEADKEMLKKIAGSSYPYGYLLKTYLEK
ncbi:MAG: hypothetical protein AAF696_24815 [Bacteroidota bacterium]